MARRGKSQARRNGQSNLPGWVWLTGGLLLGLGLTLAWFWKTGPGPNDFLLPRPDPQAEVPQPADEPVAQEPAPTRPKYDFYELLPEREVVIPDAELSAQAQAEQQAALAAAQNPPADPAASDDAAAAESPDALASDSGPRYLLQAGAFDSQGKAEELKAQIALSGEMARIESAQINGRTVYRVRLGPYANASALASAKQALSGHGIQAVAIRAQ
jgi:cell division protein FtsN